MRSWLEPPEPREYPRCTKCGSTSYEKAYLSIYDGKDVIACSDCILEYDPDELLDELDEIAKSKYEDEQFEIMRERKFENG